MAVGSGLGSTFGFSAESVYGTYVAPTKFPRHKTVSIKPTNQRVQGESIQGGILGSIGAHYVETTVGAEATVELDVQTSGLGLILQAITGGTSTSTVSTTPAYTQTHTLGDPYGKSLTLQAGRPTRAGTAVPATLKGGKVTAAEFSCEVGGLLGLSLTVDGQAYDNTTALAVASYSAASVWSGKQMCVKAGAVGSEAAVDGIRSVSVSWTNPLDTSDYTACKAGLKAEPVLNGAVEISGSLSADWLAKATLEDLAVAHTSTSLVWEFTGANITGSVNQSFKMTLPGVFFESQAQDVPGKQELTSDWAFTWKYDGTNLPSIVVISTDAAL
jgi:hypothetical protein